MLFVVHLFNFESEDYFFNLAGETCDGTVASFVGEVDLFDELLGEGGAALDALAGDGGEAGTDEGCPIYAGVVIEVTVFDGDCGLAHVGGDLVAFYDEAVISVTFILPEELTVAIVVGVDCFGDFHFV